ncbi:hypothetical protein GCM10010121_055940 [Streptomyces brasiliensis]|uniref:Uncharacterized protein n=1 Tax=Streptomyces brasiliensis TaxID=1954 RepID=A0A917KZI7_9ACTN|nr:hypothetical protein GCM10010121_055940 [Streptomyces brasiliensis]
MATRTDVSEALDRVIEALAGASKEEVVAALAAAGASSSRPSAAAAPVLSRTPLPSPRRAPHIVSEVEWV